MTTCIIEDKDPPPPPKKTKQTKTPKPRFWNVCGNGGPLNEMEEKEILHLVEADRWTCKASLKWFCLEIV